MTEWTEADICDLSAFGDATFDAVVCYGGPLSYVFERRRESLDVIRADETRWQELLTMEVEASAEAECLDLGTHLIAVIRRPLAATSPHSG